ncbi:hypothetical protein EDC01DRAFT_634174 [Geopyxis carbonaria]|nr:hypothetical protein EDC01DRAFT_634174 [Geopyxis carbonaria]
MEIIDLNNRDRCEEKSNASISSHLSFCGKQSPPDSQNGHMASSKKRKRPPLPFTPRMTSSPGLGRWKDAVTATAKQPSKFVLQAGDSLNPRRLGQLRNALELPMTGGDDDYRVLTNVRKHGGALSPAAHGMVREIISNRPRRVRIGVLTPKMRAELHQRSNRPLSWPSVQPGASVNLDALRELRRNMGLPGPVREAPLWAIRPNIRTKKATK